MTDNKIARIYEAVLELIAKENNPLKITVSDIADKCGIGKGTVYEYFKSKDDIFLMTLKHFTDLIGSDIDNIECNNFKQMFNSYYDELIKMHTRCNAAYLTIMFGDGKLITNQEMARATDILLEPLYKSMERFIAKLILQGIKEGIVNKNVDEFSIYYASVNIVSIIFAANSPIEKLSAHKSLITAEACYRAFVKQLS